MEELYRSAPDRGRDAGRFRADGRHQRPADQSPQVNVDIDRDKASALGVSAEQIESALYNAYGSQVSAIYTPTNQY